MIKTEVTPLLHAKQRASSFKLTVHGLLLCTIAIIIGYIASKAIHKYSYPHHDPSPPQSIHPNLKSFTLSSMTPSISWIGYNIIKDNEFNYTDPNDYIHNYKWFADYAQFHEYGETIGNDTNTMDKGIYNIIQKIITWITTASNRSITSFDTQWQYVVSTQTRQRVVSVVESETTFNDKDFIQYLQQLLNTKYFNESALLLMSDTFGNNEFNDININEILQQGIDSFGGGIGFGIQIYCDHQLIFDGGAGGGGGYDNLTTFQYGGGGGIQIHNISMGGGTGFETDKYIIDPNADYQQFYDVQVPYFNGLFKMKGKCETVTVISGGGSGGGFTTKSKDTNLVSWAYYDLNVTIA